MYSYAHHQCHYKLLLGETLQKCSGAWVWLIIILVIISCTDLSLYLYTCSAISSNLSLYFLHQFNYLLKIFENFYYNLVSLLFLLSYACVLCEGLSLRVMKLQININLFDHFPQKCFYRGQQCTSQFNSFAQRWWEKIHFTCSLALTPAPVISLIPALPRLQLSCCGALGNKTRQRESGL